MHLKHKGIFMTYANAMLNNRLHTYLHVLYSCLDKCIVMCILNDRLHRQIYSWLIIGVILTYMCYIHDLRASNNYIFVDEYTFVCHSCLKKSIVIYMLNYRHHTQKYRHVLYSCLDKLCFFT